MTEEHTICPIHSKSIYTCPCDYVTTAYTKPEKKVEGIPLHILNHLIGLTTEATSEHNDGWTQKAAKEKLIAIRAFINKTLMAIHRNNILRREK